MKDTISHNNSNPPENQFDIGLEITRPEKVLLRLLTGMDCFNAILKKTLDSWDYAGKKKGELFLGYALPYLILFIRDNATIWNEWAKKPDKSLKDVLGEDRYKSLLEDYGKSVSDGKKMAQSMVLAFEALRDALRSGLLSKEDASNHSSKLDQVGKQSPGAYSLSIDLLNRVPEKYKEDLSQVLIIERQYLQGLNLQDHLRVMNKWVGKEFLDQILKQAEIYDRKYGTRGLWDSGRPYEYTGYIYEEFIKLLDRHDRDKGKFEHLLAKVLRLVRPGYKKNDRLRIKKSSAKIEQFTKPGLEHPLASQDDLSNYIADGPDGGPDDFEHIESLTEHDILGSIGQKRLDSELSLNEILDRAEVLDNLKARLRKLIFDPNRKLTNDEQKVLLYRLNGDQYPKVAQKMKNKTDTVRKIGSRGLKKLQDYAKQAGDELLLAILN